MNSLPPQLSNSGLTCYLNSGMQALSACTDFVECIAALDIKYCSLKKLRLLNELLLNMNHGERMIDIATSDIFKDWKRPGQQDSFELLAHVINQVYDEIREHLEQCKEIKKRNLDQWLNVPLPLKMRMRYDFECECHFKESSPLQSEIALHLSFPKDRSNNWSFIRSRETLTIDSLLSNHFDKDAVENFQCGRKDCKIKKGFRILKLYSPLPYSICIHLQRLFWTGNKMQKINDKVSFTDLLRIKGRFLKNTVDSTSKRNDQSLIKDTGKEYKNNYSPGEESDVLYSLKSVIVHSGEESFGHYICYKNIKHSWYYTSDTSVRKVESQEVFACNPYILFYEKTEEYQVPSNIVKVDDKLYMFINALSSSKVFINWLNKMSADDSLIIKRLLYLTKLANGDNIKDRTFEDAEFKGWSNKTDVYETMKSILEEVNVDTKDNIFQHDIRRKISCKCNFEVITSQDFPWSLDLCFYDSKSSIQGIINKMFNEDQRITGKVCESENCKHEYGSQKYLLWKSPQILCIKVLRTNPNLKVYINDLLTITLLEDKVYTLHSVLTAQGSCYRKVDDDWYEVTSTSKKVYVHDVIKCEAYLLFYESQNLITFDKRLRCVLHSLSSCSSFIQWLNIVKNKKRMEKGRLIFDMMNIINGQTQDVTKEKAYSWNEDHLSDIYKLLKTILIDLEEEIKDHGLRLPMKLSIQKFYISNSFSISKEKLFLNFDVLEYSLNIQDYVDKYFRVHYKFGSKVQRFLLNSPRLILLHFKICYNKYNIKMSETISIRITKSLDRKSKEEKIYRLRSVVEHYVEDRSDTYICYKRLNYGWVCINNERIIQVKLEEVLDCRPYLAFYELCDDEGRRGPLVEDHSFNNNSLQTHSLRNSKTISFGDIAFNSHFFNFLQCISACPTLIKNLLNTSIQHPSYKKSFEMLQRFNSNKMEVLKVNEDHYLKTWAKKSYSYTLKPFIEIFNELNESTKTDLPLLIFNLSYQYETSSICRTVSRFSTSSSSSSVTIQQLWGQYFELLCNPDVNITRIHTKTSEKNLEVLFSGPLPETFGFYVSSYTSNIYVNKPFTITMTNEFCTQNNKKGGNSEVEECLDYGKCCKRYRLKSMVDNSNKCYELVNEEVFLLTESEGPILVEDFRRLSLTFLLYEV